MSAGFARHWLSTCCGRQSTSAFFQVAGVCRADFSTSSVKSSNDVANVVELLKPSAVEAIVTTSGAESDSRLGLATKEKIPWSKEEKDTLRKMWHEHKPRTEMMTALPHRTAKSISGLLGFWARPSFVQPAWTKVEEDLLIFGKQQGMTIPQISRELLPSRSQTSCARKSQALRLKPELKVPARSLQLFSEDDKQKIKALHAQCCSCTDIATDMNRSPASIRDLLERLGLQPVTHPRKPCRWSQAETELARNIIGKGTTYEQRRALFPTRSDASISNRLTQLRKETGQLTSRGEDWSPADEEQCMKLYLSRINVYDIARELGRTTAAVSRRLYRPNGLVHRIRAAHKGQDT